MSRKSIDSVKILSIEFGKSMMTTKTFRYYIYIYTDFFLFYYKQVYICSFSEENFSSFGFFEEKRFKKDKRDSKAALAVHLIFKLPTKV